MTYFVETNQFKQMISYNPYVTTSKDKKKVKYSLLDRIQEVLGDKWNRFKEGTRQSFDMICFLGTELGFFYAGDEYLAERHAISDRTVRNRLKELEELGQVIKVHRRATRCNGRGKPIYLFVNHPYFHYWVELLGIQSEDFQTDFQTENQETSWESKDEGAKNFPTYLLPKKQERDINISNNKIVQYVVNRVNDSINKGNRIKYLSSYIDRMVRSLEWQALYAENRRQKTIRKQQEEENAKVIREILGLKKKEIPFYNWLEQ
ncbi:DeoR family transcriptional regulator [Bacillus sp. ISL-7]|uniref:DeoR family transcriptional regulator n=1 Tax=Bacillus sp. ISL-7 TaxID=2819136 RepID=UPI001BE9A230|nr:DeoR family transcriptional regulator [Bacillus sp. ISL-7]MBT2734111.1 HTH domain-containing protein [Bacillus sp. ISL-7]